MSGPLITIGSEGFQQSGQIDWVSLSRSSFSFGLDVLVRLSKAELDVATIAISLVIFNRFALNPESQKRIHDALSKLKSFSSYGKLVWFGFGIKSVLKDLASFESGMACIALCACLSTSYDSFFAAGVLRELCKLNGAPQDHLPSIHQWKALVDICAGSIYHSKFPVLLEGMLRCVLPVAETSLRKPTSKEALAEAIQALADISTGKLENITVSGGVDCIWLAAISEWLLSLHVEICHSSGTTVYKSPSNADCRYRSVTVIFVSDSEKAPYLSKCYNVPKGTKLWTSSSPEQHLFAGGRSEWNSILADAFGMYFNILIEKDMQREFAFFLFHNSQLAQAYHRYGSKPNNITHNYVKSRSFLRRVHFPHSASQGQTLLSLAKQNLPELAAIQNILEQAEIESRFDTNLADSIRNIKSRCACQWCRSRIISPGYDNQPFCLLLVAETIFLLLVILSVIEADPSLKPSSNGLRLLYKKLQLRNHLKENNQKEQETWTNIPLADSATNGLDILTVVLIIFSGLDSLEIGANNEASSISRNGICAYFKALEDLNLSPDEALTVKAVPGQIQFEGMKYGKICDIVDDTRIAQEGLEPCPTFKLLVQEISEPDVIAAAYQLSYNMGSQKSLLGISELEKAITQSIRGPVQCTELCGRSPYSVQEAIVLCPNTPCLATTLSDQLQGPPPFLRQWSLISTENQDKETIQLRIVQAEIYRLYSEIVGGNEYHLAYLNICQACSSTIPSTQRYDKGAASLLSDMDTANEWSLKGTITVSSPSGTRSWMDRRFQIFVIDRSIQDGEQTIVTDAHNPITLSPKCRSRRTYANEPALLMAARLQYEGILRLLIQGGVRASCTSIDGETALHVAAEEGHIEILRTLLGRGAPLELKDRSGLTPLVRAARSGVKSTVESMMWYNADLNSRDNHGQSVLAWAADRGHLAVVELLLQGKADVNVAAGCRGRTALQAAAEGGHIEVVERLLQEKADVNAAAAAYYNGRTALQAAAGGGHLAVVERLLQEKADVNTAAADHDGRTALQAAAGGGHLAVVERLLQEKADVNAAAAEFNGRTALQAAAEGGHLAVAERLLQEKADVNAAAAAEGFNGRTALQAAAEGGHLAVVERLLQEKADVNAAAVKYDGRTALQAAGGGGHLAVVERLLQEKADVNAAAAAAEGFNGRTALQAAAEGGHLAVVERLLQEKADVNAAAATDHDGRTALQAAAEGGHLAVVERLLQEKADVNAAAAFNGRTALQAAAGGGHLAVVERLLQEKADVNAEAAFNGRTALQAAAGGGHLAVVERLLQEKADVNTAAADHDGRTALQAAAEGGHLAVVERLLQEKADVNAAAEFNGRTALQAAAGGGHLAVVERLLQEKVDVNAAAAAGSNGRTALQAAVKGGHQTVSIRLLKAGASN
jgi:ankyrin repeat protein